MDSTANIDSSFSVDGDDAKAWWKPVVKELQAFGGNNDIANHSLFYIFIIGFVGGLLALVMPCIWPIIPMTVSFFLKRAKNDKKKGIRDAITYGLSIVIIYLALGLTVTAIAGPSTLNALEYKCGIQHHPLLASGSLRILILRMVRNQVARQLG